jgi:hypothetical protein
MQHIGYSLIDAQGNELQVWGDELGALRKPDRVIWPNGDITEGVSGPMDRGDWRFVERHGEMGDTQSVTYNGTVVVKVFQAPSLQSVKSDLIGRLDTDAERVRKKYKTEGTGMAMTYQEKKDQALAVIQMGEAAANALANDGAAEFPVLSASVPVEAVSLYAAAELVISKYEQWSVLAGIIERTRNNAKKSISDASDAASARAAYEAIIWTV